MATQIRQTSEKSRTEAPKVNHRKLALILMGLKLLRVSSYEGKVMSLKGVKNTH